MSKITLKKGITKRLFAKLIGVSEPTVSNYFRDGLLDDDCLKGDGKRKLIIPEIAIRQLAERLDTRRSKKGREPVCKELNEQRSLSAEYKAKLAKQRFEKKLSKYIELDFVNRQLAKANAIMRDVFSKVPGRIAAKLGGSAADQAFNERLLRAEIDFALKGLIEKIEPPK